MTPQDSVALNNRGNATAGQQKWQNALADYQLATESYFHYEIRN